MRQALQMELPLRALFENPTVAELALKIEQPATETDELEPACNLVGVELLSEEETARQLVEEN